MQFKYADGYNAPVAPEVAGHELERIREENSGALHSATVVDEARPESAPLHPVFEWRNEVAAEEYRKVQARQLIRGIKVRYDSAKDAHESRMYVNIRTGKAQHYVPAVEAMSDADMRAHVLDRLQKTLNHYQQEVEDLQGLSGVKSHLRRLIEEVENEAQESPCANTREAETA